MHIRVSELRNHDIMAILIIVNIYQIVSRIIERVINSKIGYADNLIAKFTNEIFFLNNRILLLDSVDSSVKYSTTTLTTISSRKLLPTTTTTYSTKTTTTTKKTTTTTTTSKTTTTSIQLRKTTLPTVVKYQVGDCSSNPCQVDFYNFSF